MGLWSGHGVLIGKSWVMSQSVAILFSTCIRQRARSLMWSVCYIKVMGLDVGSRKHDWGCVS